MHNLIAQFVENVFWGRQIQVSETAYWSSGPVGQIVTDGWTRKQENDLRVIHQDHSRYHNDPNNDMSNHDGKAKG